jgi:hypothetical protein
MVTTSTSSNLKAIILDKPSDWRPWLFVVKGLANTDKVWKYIDPDLSTEPELSKLPELLSLTEVNASKATLNALDEKEKELYKLLLAVYKEETAKTTKIINAVDAVIAGGLSGLEGNRRDCNTIEKQCSGKVIVLYSA